MNPEEIQKELDRLWSKVSAENSSDVPMVLSESTTVHDITLDAISLLKRQHRQKEAGWRELLDAKERAVEAHRLRLEALEAELARARRRLESSDEVIVEEVLQARSKLEAGFKAMEAERARNEAERRSIEDLLAATRERLAAESSRVLQQQDEFHRREQQYLLDIKGLEVRAQRHEERASDEQSNAARLSDNLKEAKNALEKTLAELLRERQVRETTEKERVQALKKVDDLEKHFKELNLIWEEERSQWRELWDRERSTWETQRREVESWESSLRKERESWQSEISGQEAQHVAFVSKINESLRESTRTSERLASVIRVLDSLPGVRIPGGQGLRLGKGALAGALAVVLCVAAFPLWSHFSKPRLKAVSTQPVVLEDPTGMAYDGALVWVSQWNGELRSYDPQDLKGVLQTFKIQSHGPYRPTALAHAGEFLWSVDSAQAKLHKHQAGKPGKILASLSAPGPAPSALTFDGTSLWLYDAATQSIYRQKGDGADFAPVPAEVDIVPAAMAFLKGRLWAFDSKTRDIVVLELEDGKLRFVTRRPMDQAFLALSAAGEELWALAGPAMDRPGHALVKFSTR